MLLQAGLAAWSFYRIYCPGVLRGLESSESQSGDGRTDRTVRPGSGVEEAWPASGGLVGRDEVAGFSSSVDGGAGGPTCSGESHGSRAMHDRSAPTRTPSRSASPRRAMKGRGRQGGFFRSRQMGQEPGPRQHCSSVEPPKEGSTPVKT